MQLPPVAPVRAASFRGSGPPLPKHTAEGGSYSDRFRQRQTAAAAAKATPNLGSATEFPSLAPPPLIGTASASAAATHSYSSWASKAAALAELDAREEEARRMRIAAAEAAAAAEIPIACFQVTRAFKDAPIEAYEEEDNLRGLAAGGDEEESYTPPYGRYDYEENAGEEQHGNEGGGYGEEEDRW
jgi:hypothetical protein